MKSTAQQNDAGIYCINYAAAPWIEPGISIGIFANIQIGANDLLEADFREGTDGTDTLYIFITPGADGTPVCQQLLHFPLYPGTDKSNISNQVMLSVENRLTGGALLQPLTLMYGKDSYHPVPKPLEPYMISYLSGPYASYNGHRTPYDEVYVILNTIVREDDQVNAVFTVSESELYDTFELQITSDNRGKPEPLCQAFGPYQLTNTATVTVMASTVVNGRPAQKPIGIKSYGNDCWFA